MEYICEMQFWFKNTYENMKKIQTKILCIHLDIVYAHNKVSWVN
jgi:hypothetical protein